MQRIFSCQQASELEKKAKEKFAIPPFLMMENAARAMAEFCTKESRLVIVCGKGNNGGDGYALARLLQTKINVTVFALEAPAAEEAKAQYEMCRRLGLKIINASEEPDFQILFEKLCKSLTADDYIADCIYGTGFHGTLSPDVKKIIDIMNKSRACKLACDIPSALEFSADYTITMGCQKLALYSDTAKAVSGKIIVADLGIARDKFEADTEAASLQTQTNNLFLVEPEDCELPFRKNRAVHKGKFGHTAVLCGDKSGAAILAASAAMNFGSGLTSLLKSSSSDLNQFKISPALMISDCLPKKTSCILAGSGFSDFSKDTAKILTDWFYSFNSSGSRTSQTSTTSPAAVLDAGMLTSPESPAFLDSLNSIKNARIILTPHLSELKRLLEHCGAEGDFSIEALAESPEARIAAGNYLTTRFPQSTVIMKSANTFIACGGETFVITDGAQSLAKGGSGDLLAGMAAALLAQGYPAKSAAITAAEHHALISQKAGSENYNLTPEVFLSLL